jgi:F-type H+-transporting ATPase subunit delta
LSHFIIKRYAKALFDLSCEQQNTETVRQDMIGILETMDASVELAQFFDNPIIPAAKRRVILQKIFEGKVDTLMYHFILFLEEKRRLRFLRDIARAFEGIFLEANNIAKVKITTSIGLTQQQREAVSKSLQSKFNKVIDPHLDVDPAVLGGIKIQKGDEIYDYSLRAQLERFKERVAGAL